MTMSLLNYYSVNYLDCRRKFLAATKAAGFSVDSFVNPLMGAKGEELATDVVLIGSISASKLLVIISGTHGVETFAGAAYQTGWISEERWQQLPEDTAVLLIHCINPYGASWRRRYNEDNVDLNRNFVVHPTGHIENNLYAQIHPFIVPPALEGEEREVCENALRELRHDFGETKFMQAILGQYSHPTGYGFGGWEPVWSNQTLAYIIDKYCSACSRLAVLDIHTGLGPYGYGLVGVAHAPESEAAVRARQWFGVPMATFAEVAGEYDFPDYEKYVDGLLLTAFIKNLPKTEVTAAGIEFGTFPYDDVLACERDELWLYNHPNADARTAEQVRRKALRGYYPQQRDWQEMVWWRCDQVVRQALSGLQMTEINL